MTQKDKIRKEIKLLVKAAPELIKQLRDKEGKENFRFDYQDWYSKALKAVELLASDRYEEFRSYYEPDPKRKIMSYGNYVIQDYMKRIVPNPHSHPNFDPIKQTVQNIINQLTILNSIIGRINSILNDVALGLLAELQEAEIDTARQLIKVNHRAAGSLVGVVIEEHLQKIASRHKVLIKKKSPTINELNEPLRLAGVYDMPIGRKIALLADIRNLCSHKKDREPTKDEVVELINGANWLIKTVF